MGIDAAFQKWQQNPIVSWHQIKHFVDARIILIPFETKGGNYFIEACFDSKKFLEG